jgi:hypothetical protein
MQENWAFKKFWKIFKNIKIPLEKQNLENCAATVHDTVVCKP